MKELRWRTVEWFHEEKKWVDVRLRIRWPNICGKRASLCLEGKRRKTEKMQVTAERRQNASIAWGEQQTTRERSMTSGANRRVGGKAYREHYDTTTDGKGKERALSKPHTRYSWRQILLSPRSRITRVHQTSPLLIPHSRFDPPHLSDAPLRFITDPVK